jgi:Flp pilus assembly protein TadD
MKENVTMIAESLFTKRPWLIVLLLAIITVAAYGHLFTNEFVYFDDDQYIMDNTWVQQGLHIDSMRWAFSLEREDNTYWHPMTWLSLMVDHDLFGLNPAGYHLMNLFLHIASSIILFFVLKRITGGIWQSAFVAAVFSLHPLNVESVAWAVERKSVLSTFFWMLSLWAYVRYAERPSWLRYLPVFIFLALGLMAKSMLVSLPLALLMLDFWPLRRIKLGGEKRKDGSEGASLVWIVVEKIPLLALSLLSVAASFISVKPDDKGQLSPLDLRLSEAVVSYVKYLAKMVWPTDLVVFYPPHLSYPGWQVAGAALLLLAITAATLLLARKCPWLPVGWFWYLAVMFPVSGLVRHGLWPAMADRFAYLPMIGILIMVAWSIPALARQNTRIRMLIAGAALLICAAFSLLTWTQAGHWQTSRTLFEHAIANGEDNIDIRKNYGFALSREGKFEEALQQFRVTVEQRPDKAMPHFNVGACLDKLGRVDEAMAEYGEALRLDPDYTDAHNNIGMYLFGKGRNEEAKQHLLTALRSRPKDPDILLNLGLVFDALKESAEAVKYLSEAVRLSPVSIEAHSALGSILGRTGKYREAIVQYSEVLKLDPTNVTARKSIEFASGRL